MTTASPGTAPHPLLPSSTGQFDPQIVVDPLDRQTVYASWLQNNKRDVMVARSQDFGHTWNLAVAERSADDADKPVLAVRGPDVYVGFNHEQKFLVAASHDYAGTFTSVEVNPNAEPGWSLAGGATVDTSGGVYFSWMAYARQELSTRPVDIFVSRSSDAGRSWNTVLLDVSSAPPDCSAQACQAGFLGRRSRSLPTPREPSTRFGTPAQHRAASSAFIFLLPPPAARVGRQKLICLRPLTTSNILSPQSPPAPPAMSASPGWTPAMLRSGMFICAVKQRRRDLVGRDPTLKPSARLRLHHAPGLPIPFWRLLFHRNR